MKKELYKAYIALGLVSFFWGTTYMLPGSGRSTCPGFCAGLRQLFSGLILVGFFLIKGYQIARMGSDEKDFCAEYLYDLYRQWLVDLVGGIYQRGTGMQSLRHWFLYLLHYLRYGLINVQRLPGG